MADPGPTTWSLLDLPPELLVLIGEALSPDFCGVVALSATCQLLRDLLYNDANHLWTRLYTAQKGWTLDDAMARAERHALNAIEYETPNQPQPVDDDGPEGPTDFAAALRDRVVANRNLESGRCAEWWEEDRFRHKQALHISASARNPLVMVGARGGAVAYRRIDRPAGTGAYLMRVISYTAGAEVWGTGVATGHVAQTGFGDGFRVTDRNTQRRFVFSRNPEAGRPAWGVELGDDVADDGSGGLCGTAVACGVDVSVWDLASGEVVAELPVPHGHGSLEVVSSVKFDDEFIICGTYGGWVHAWRIEASSDPDHRNEYVKLGSEQMHLSRIRCVALWRNRAVSVAMDGSILLWELGGAEETSAEADAQPATSAVSGQDTDGSDSADSGDIDGAGDGRKGKASRTVAEPSQVVNQAAGLRVVHAVVGVDHGRAWRGVAMNDVVVVAGCETDGIHVFRAVEPYDSLYHLAAGRNVVAVAFHGHDTLVAAGRFFLAAFDFSADAADAYERQQRDDNGDEGGAGDEG